MKMIIDTHGHVGLHNIHSNYTDAHCENLYRKYGIVKGVFSSIVSILGELERGNQEMYEYLNRFEFAYGYIVVNPQCLDDSIIEMKKYLGKEKIVGLKLHTSYSDTAIDSPKMDEILRIFDSYGQVILVHCEHSNAKSEPHHVLEMASRYSNTKFIIAHHGCAMWQETCDTAKQLPNIYVDTISSFSEYDVIKKLVDEVGDDKILFGSDVGLFDPAPFIGNILSAEISEQARHKIFYQNAKTLFGF